MLIFSWWYIAVIGISWIWTYIMLDWFCTGLKTWELNVFCSLFNFVSSYLLISLWVPGILKGCEIFILKCKHRWGPTMPGLLRPVSYEPKRLKRTKGGWLEKFQYGLVWGTVPCSTSAHWCCAPCFAYGWTQKDMKRSFTVALMAGCQGQAFSVWHDERWLC